MKIAPNLCVGLAGVAERLLFRTSSQMGIGFFGYFLILSLFFRTFLSQEPNTDEFFVSDFLQQMGLSSSEYNFTSPVCSWKGVFCDRNGQNVNALVLSGLGLSGLIPENTIGKLTMLQSLDLSHNRITGFSSDFWGLGLSLRSLNLSHNPIDGPLPSNIGNFGMLEYLDLSSNSFSGSIPESFSTLSALQFVNLSRNDFNGNLPDGILNCKSLVSLDASSNRLNGTVPKGLGAVFPDLRFLNLGRNEFQGGVSDLSGLKSLTYLNLSGNLFTGAVNTVLQKPLEVIDLSQNQFQGHVSQVHFSSSLDWSSLVFLDLSQNQLSGKLFDLIQAQYLKHLNLAHNRFSHQKFPQLEKLFHLEYLNLSKTSLIGPIPRQLFSQLNNLKALDLSQNHLSGPISDGGGVSNLRIIDLSQNNLTGEIPSLLLQRLSGMEKFNFSYNNLSLCASNFSLEIFNSAFFGSQDNCPIAADADLFKKKEHRSKRFKLALAITLSLFCVTLGLVGLAFACRRKSKPWTVKQLSFKEDPNLSGPFSFQTDSTTWVADVRSATSVPVVIFDKPLLNFTFADLLSVTSNFDRGTLLAEGRFGPVYRGFLPGGTHIAVKVLVHGSTMSDQEAAKELEYLGQVKHPNLVPLIGYCLAGDQRIAIYEYMENGNLQNLLHDLPLGVPRTEDWSTDTWEEDESNVQNVLSAEALTTWAFRHKVALGTARSLAFLHHGCFPRIIHRDVKASSVYLGPVMEPRLSDFGLAKIFGSSLADELTRGSPGYTPPELSQPNESAVATSKSDVYGFGVVLFELLSGKKPLGDEYPDENESNLVSWVRGLVRKNQASRAIDPKIRDTGSETQMVEALRIGYLCTADLPSKRPDMQQIVGLLKDIEPGTSH
ncbi:probable LRR receptor-like serine/threonine-protein kinase At2g24230 [Aristolochia californica]|uniref:probable LRR receptor-like serine/threonine-protein kinase At2g24230 n=1 Tax=Aristolochia californica TaxID=171875 RepID=UPI0035D789F5